MPRNLNDLAISLTKRVKEIEKAANDLAVQTALNILKVLLERTPVDTTQALSNWQASLLIRAVGFLPAHVPGNSGYTQTASASVAYSLAVGLLKRKKNGEIIYLVNNTPYIRDLNSGTSRQAPAGFVEASVLVARKQMPRLKLKA